MARSLSDILRRFRPAIAPGPAAPAGVPADRLAEAEVELAGVFATLAPTIAEATRLVEEARAEAEARRLKAMAEAQALSADARSQIEAVRSAAAAGCLRLLADERAAAAATAKAEVERIQRTAEARLPGLVVRVMNDVRATASGSAVVGTDAQLAAGRRS